MKQNRLGSEKVEEIAYVHSNLRLVSRKGEEYTSGPHKDWDVDAENPDLDISLATLDIKDGGGGSGSGGPSSSKQLPSSIEQASYSIFEDDDEET